MKNVMFIWLMVAGISLHASCDMFTNADLSAFKNKIFSDQAVVFSGNANKELATKVTKELNVSLGNSIVQKFNDGEIQIQIQENVRNKDIYIVQPTCPCATQSINDNLMELFLLVRTMKRSSAKSVTAVIPYYGYARQDRKTSPRVPISAADTALMLETAGVDRVLTVDLHCGQIQGFFKNSPVDNLYAASVFIPYLITKKLNNVVVVSPDAGGVDRANKFKKQLAKKGIPSEIAMISKQRAGAGVIESMNLIGDVNGADVIIVDDMCDTGGTLVKAAKLLKDKGAKRVFAAITHPVFSGKALKIIGESVIDEMVIADTIPLRAEAPSNIKVISVAPMLAEAIKRIQFGESVSELFQ
ncbi:MAG: ribose-phosphate pyrophosphokinase [Candidatus Babeliales bacterium]|nr:ribose-phosphate pyrophosphokinase [Candidatus Babeliales bacterium]